jgi:hypothetical protein|tara:strand:- start:639 stop:872 length:234 start_codon:yes stop_codon:yes gene_type:complete
MYRPSLREQIVSAVRSSAEGEIQKARANVEVYLQSPVGIGEHPDVLGAIQDQLDIIASNEERLQVIDKHFDINETGF